MEIQELINSIKQVLKDYTAGSLSTEQVNEHYRELSASYDKLESSKGKKHGDGIVRGICYYHNIENYALLTGIYRVDRDTIDPSAYYGDIQSHRVICSLNPGIIDSIQPSIIFTIEPDEIPGFKHAIHLYSLADDGTSIYVLTSVTSSRFFTVEKFLNCAEILSFLYSEVLFETRPHVLSLYGNARKDVEAYVFAELKRGSPLNIRYYTFGLAEKIFNHLGIHALMEIPDAIVAGLKKNMSPGAKLFHLSLWEFIVINAETGGDDPVKTRSKKIEFQFRAITLPYHSLSTLVDSEEALYKTWDHFRKIHYEYITGEPAL